EKILLATRQEVPHSSVVLIERVEEKADKDGKPLLVVEATIGVEKENQKAILIGKGGSMLKAIGTDARRDIEAELGLRCHLALTVAVRRSWREDNSVLDRIFLGTRALVASEGASERDVDDDDDDDDDGGQGGEDE